jgi:hypothetical protein
MSELDAWVNTTEGAALTGYAQGTVRMLARTHRVTARKVGRDWLVERRGLLEYRDAMERLGLDKHDPRRGSREPEWSMDEAREGQ